MMINMEYQGTQKIVHTEPQRNSTRENVWNFVAVSKCQISFLSNINIYSQMIRDINKHFS